MAARKPPVAGDDADSDDSMKADFPSFSAVERSVACETDKGQETETTDFVQGTPEQGPLRILLLGRSGSGKSCTGNTILGQKLFKSPKRYTGRVTTTCEEQTCHVAGGEVCVIDTPDIMDPNLTEDQINKEKETLLSLCQAGLHAVLLLVPIGEDLQDEEEILHFTKDLLSQQILNFVIVLFTKGDQLEDDETLDEYVQTKETELQSLIRSCGNRIHSFNNMEKKQSQVAALLEKISKMVIKNRGIFKKRKSLETTEFAGPDKQLPQLRLVLLGKTGVGKSASGNTILGRNLFKSEVSSASQTKQCSVQKTVREGKEMSVIDTPGLFDNTLTNDEVIQEIMKCLTLASPGPHAFLIVIRLERFTPEEKSTIKALKEIFGEASIKYTMILFTYKDRLGIKTVEEFLRDGDKDLNQLVKDCDNRFHSFDNMSRKSNQFKEFLFKMESMISRNESSFYSNELFEDVEKAINDVEKEKLDEKVKQCKEDNPEISSTEWQKIYWKLVEESRNEAKEMIIRDMYAVGLAVLFGKINVTAAEKESAIKASERIGISRSVALRLAARATRKLAVRVMCGIQ